MSITHAHTRLLTLFILADSTTAFIYLAVSHILNAHAHSSFADVKLASLYSPESVVHHLHCVYFATWKDNETIFTKSQHINI